MDKPVREQSFLTLYNCFTVSHYPLGIDYDDGVTLLFRRVTESIFEEDYCKYHYHFMKLPDWRQNCELRRNKGRLPPCNCEADNHLYYTQAIVSVSGDANNVRPYEAVFVVRIVQGVSTVSCIQEDLENAENVTVEFSISDSMNDWEENPHLPYIQKYLRHCTYSQLFPNFRGQASNKAYVSAFDTIVQKILSTPSPTAVTVGGKTNPHFGKRIKKV